MLTFTDPGPRWTKRLACLFLGHRWRVVRWTVLVERNRCIRCGAVRTTMRRHA